MFRTYCHRFARVHCGHNDVFAPSDLNSVTHLTSSDTILMRSAVMESLDPASPNIVSDMNNPMQPYDSAQDR